MASGRVESYTGAQVRLAWAARTDVGKVRRLNEDSLIAEPGLFAIADGMGGHAAGDVASSLVVEQLRALVSAVPLDLDRVASIVAGINAAVREQARSTGNEGMGTTLVAALLVDNAGSDSIVVVNVGDSRCYSYDEAGLRVLTHDHSVVQELVDAGEISAEDARSHPERNVVTRAIGADDLVVPDYVVVEPAPHQRLLLCSDGVSGQVSHEFLRDVMATSPDPAAAIDAIFDHVLGGGAPDNATAIVIDVGWVGQFIDPIEITAPRPSLVDAVTGPRPNRDGSGEADS